MTTPTIEFRTANKSSWGEGPWNDEPDKVQWQDDATGLACLARRNHLGVWCGYVGVTKDHPWHQVCFDDVYDGVYLWDRVECIRQITYSDFCQDGPEDEAICHVPGDGDPDDVWWFGFAFGEYYDFCPAFMARERQLEKKHRVRSTHDLFDQKYVKLDVCKTACADLARQLAAVGK